MRIVCVWIFLALAVLPAQAQIDDPSPFWLTAEMDWLSEQLATDDRVAYQLVPNTADIELVIRHVGDEQYAYIFPEYMIRFAYERGSGSLREISIIGKPHEHGVVPALVMQAFMTLLRERIGVDTTPADAPFGFRAYRERDATIRLVGHLLRAREARCCQEK